MNTWVLILILFADSSSPPVGITSVPGFKSVKDCYAAGYDAQADALDHALIPYRCISTDRAK